MKKATILIADDHPAIHSGLQMILSSSITYRFEFMFAESGYEALKMYEYHKPDLIITDIRMPNLDGIEFTRKFRTFNSETPILMFSVLSNFESVNRSIESGCNGYLSKSSRQEEILRAVETLLCGQNYFSEDVSNIIMNSQMRHLDSSLTQILTQRELEVLQLISEDNSQSEIAKKLNVSPRTIEGHARNLRIKLKAKSSVGLIMNALKEGLI